MSRPVSPGTAGAGNASIAGMPSAAVTLTLPEPILGALRAKVASGEYASESAVIEDGLRLLLEQDAAFGRWLTEDVMASIEAHGRDPADVVPVDEIMDRIRAGEAAA